MPSTDTQAAATWALVIGIDQYDSPDVRRLTGAVNDAVATVRWLRKLGVPDAQILMHAAPSTSSQAAVDELALPYKDAREPTIWRSIVALQKVEGAERLIVSLCGHGLHEYTSGALFLTQEASEDDWVNLGLEWYIKVFLEMSFREQILFMDGCLNHPHDDNTRPQVEAGKHSGAPKPAPRDENSMVTCYAASQSQVAGENGERGIFTRCLLAALDPDAPLKEAVALSFETGERTLNLVKVMEVVGRQVTSEAARQVPLVVQRPRLELHGTAGATPGYVGLYQLARLETCQVTLDVLPADARGEVDYIDILFDDDPPYWSSRWPLDGGSLAVPVQAQLPKGYRISAYCGLWPQAAWSPLKSRQDATLDGDRNVLFEFKGPPIKSDGEDVLGVKLHDAEGQISSAMSGLYSDAASMLDLPAKPKSGSEIAPGVTIQLHEDGPEFHVTGIDAAETARDIVADWSRVMREILPSDVIVTTELRGEAASAPPAGGINFELPTGGSARLAGSLGSHPVVTVGRPGLVGHEPRWHGIEQMSLLDLQQQPLRLFPPGPTEVLLELPWGSWSQVVQVPDTGTAELVLPDSVGVPPLRLRVPPLDYLYGRHIVGLDQAPRSGARGHIVRSDGETTELASGEAGDGICWVLDAPGEGIAEIDGEHASCFPLWENRSFAIDRSHGILRVEPLTWVAAPEWDLLLSAGRLDDLTLEDTAELSYKKWEDPLLGLASAYAYRAQDAWDELGVVLGNLWRLFDFERSPVDLDILAAETPGLDPAVSILARGRLADRADREEVPLLRWGVGLALDILDRGPLESLALNRWREQLKQIERTLSAVSVWTAWTLSDRPM